MSTFSPLRRKVETMLVVRSTPSIAPISRGRSAEKPASEVCWVGWTT
jgi:hypothetical protein